MLVGLPPHAHVHVQHKVSKFEGTTCTTTIVSVFGRISLFLCLIPILVSLFRIFTSLKLGTQRSTSQKEHNAVHWINLF